MKEMLYDYMKWLILELKDNISLGGFVLGFLGGVWLVGFWLFFFFFFFP